MTLASWTLTNKVPFTFNVLSLQGFSKYNWCVRYCNFIVFPAKIREINWSFIVISRKNYHMGLHAFSVTLKVFGSMVWKVFMTQLCDAKTAVGYKARPFLPLTSMPIALTQIIPMHLKMRSSVTDLSSKSFKINGTTWKKSQ